MASCTQSEEDDLAVTVVCQVWERKNWQSLHVFLKSDGSTAEIVLIAQNVTNLSRLKTVNTINLMSHPSNRHPKKYEKYKKRSKE